MKYLLILFLSFLSPFPVIAQDEPVTETTTVETPQPIAETPHGTTETAQAPNAAAVPVVLTVKAGGPDSNASSQEFRLNSGETAFVQTSDVNLKPNQISPAEKQEQEAYKARLAQINTQIVNQIAAVQSKEKAIRNEIYIAHVPALEDDRRGLQDQLGSLQQSRDKIVAEHTAREASKPPPPPAPPPEIAEGINISPSIENNRAVMKVTTQDQVETVVQAPLGQWVQVYSTEDDSGSLWAKVDAVNH